MSDKKNTVDDFERLRICPVPDDDPVGPFVVGLVLFPFLIFALTLVVFVLSRAIPFAYSILARLGGAS